MSTSTAYDLLTVINFVEGVIMPSLQSVAEYDVSPSEEDFYVTDKVTTRAKVRYESRQYSQELRAMGYNARKGNSKSKAVMLRKRGRI